MYIKNKNDIKNTIQQLQQDKSKHYLVLSAEKSDKLLNECLEAMNKAGLSYFGGSFPSIISEYQVHEEGLVIAAIESSWSPLIIEDLSKTNQVIKKLGQLKNIKNGQSCLTFVDGLSHQTPFFLNQLYSHLGPNYRYLGGGAGSLSLKPTPCLFDNQGFYSNGAIILLTDKKWSIGVQHGWEPISEPMVATEVQGNNIKKINWRPAIEVYKEVIGELTSDQLTIENFFNVAKSFPFGILKESDDCVVRDPIILNEDGSITCVGSIPKGSSIQVLTAKSEQLLNAAEKAANEALEETSEPQISLIIDCISRGIFLGDEITNELGVANKSNPPHNSIGALTLGEIASSKNGLLELYNKTFVYGAVA
ncbi:MAG: FIST C-terminal domain-containing protein [Bdellovibrionales bacterium]|nr:FIST C-terminal domain-containing protein [Bdellovibrionales bacterium]NQZ17703.1 FIST C-terminal domain-containing protein [Bdellovibrionales bacterium]